MKKGQIKAKFPSKNFIKCLKFAQICSKHALKYTIFVNIKKWPKMAKWPNHFISGKQFQKRPNGNPDLFCFP